MWGKTTGEAEKLIHDELNDPGIRISQIGPAGEKLVRFACIIENLNDAAGRNGLGAVMGSKNLRAIAVRGSNRNIKVADPDLVSGISKKFLSTWRDYASGLRDLGTSQDVLGLNLSLIHI